MIPGTGLRGRILLATVLTPLALGIVTLVTVQRDVREHVDSSSIHESLSHTESVFESMLATRSRALVGGAQVIAQDPRCFSLLMLTDAQRDPRFQATVRGMAHDFNRITETEIFEVLDRRGRVLASVGGARSSKAAREPLVRRALRGEAVEGVLTEAGAHYQVAVAPARADGGIVGALLLGAPIGDSLAGQLRGQMRCDVTFISGSTITGSTLARSADRAALLHLLAATNLGPGADLRRLGVLRVETPTGTQLTIVRRLPGADPALRQLYVLQRAFDPETLFRRRMQQDLLRLAAIAVLVAIAGGLLLGTRIVRPVLALVRAARAMESGDYDHPLPSPGRDEIGYLARRFADMRQRERGYVESLERAARVKSDFIRIASQQLRSPISGLKGFRELLAGGQLGEVTDAQKRALDAMKNDLDVLGRLADEATQVVELQGERLQMALAPQPLETLLHHTLGQAHAARLREGVSLVPSLPETAPEVWVDPERLPRALAELVVIAARETGAGGRVAVEAACDERTLVLRVGAADDEHPAGPGVDPDTLGLGVALARGVIEAHGGRLMACASVGATPSFRIELPLRPAGEEREAA